MLPRWLAVLGFVGLCTSFACFPPIAVAPIGTSYQPTGASPRPSSGLVRPSASPSVPPLGPGSAGGRPAAGVEAASYFPVKAGTWRFRVATTPTGGTAVAGERSLVLADVVTSGDATTASATSTTTLNVPGFKALDEAAVRGQVALTRDRFSLTTAGRTTAIPLTAAAGDHWDENGLRVQLVTWADRLTVDGQAYDGVLQVAYTDPAAPSTPHATTWFAPGVGLVQRLDTFTHDGKAWEARAVLIDHPGK